MKDFDKDKPAVLIHIPKTAGISVKEIYTAWFGESLLFHYCSGGVEGGLPEKYDLMGKYSGENPQFIYGHFNRSKYFGIEHYYPEVDQFITILRDPFEMAVSGFFYVKKTNPRWREQLNLPKGSLREYLSVMRSGLLNFFPYEVTMDNYQEMIETKFIEVGVTEFLDRSMQRIARKLGHSYTPNSLKRLNITERDQNVPYELKESFVERHQLEYAIYNYVLNKYI